MSIWGSLGFQDRGSFFIEQLVFFYDHSFIVLLLVIFSVFYFLFSSFFTGSYFLGGGEIHFLEFVWTVFPCFLLLFIAFPSLKILYIIDESCGGFLTYKALGYQWYWVYEYSDFGSGEYFSYMEGVGDFRLVDCDDRLYLPYMVPVRMVVSSGDVIHSWTIPSLGVRADAVPGRLNQLILCCNRLCYLVGQCSELCGAGHSFIPIVAEVVPVFCVYLVF